MKAFIVGLLVTASFIATAQDVEEKPIKAFLPKGEWGIGLQFLAPLGDFAGQYPSAPVGINANYYRTIGNKFMVGAELSTACLSHADYEIELPNGEMGMLHEDENMWAFLIGTKFNFLGNEKFRSYTEIKAGTNTFYTSVSSCEESLQHMNESKVHGTSFVTGIGVGFTFDPKAVLGGDSGKTWISVRGNYTAGTAVNYRNAPESTSRAALNQHVVNSNLSYVDIGVSASWQIR